MVLLALIVGLAALYTWGELHYGTFAGFALAGGVPIALAIILVLAALAIAKQSAKESSWQLPDRPRQPTRLARESQESEVRQLAEGLATPPPRVSSADPEDLVEPLAVLFGRYLPGTGHPAIDDILRQVESRAYGTTREAAARGADLIRTGNRASMLGVLGAATLFGWLLVRGTPHR